MRARRRMISSVALNSRSASVTLLALNALF